MDSKLLDNICDDKNFLESLVKLENDQDIKKAFHKKGLEMSDNEIKQFKADVIKAINNENELSDLELDFVAGGKSSWIGKNWQKLVYATSAVALTGTAIWAVKTLTNEGRKIIKKADKTLNNVDSFTVSAKSLADKANEGKLIENANDIADRVKHKGIKDIIF